MGSINKNIVLTGFMGTGKTVVGKKLAERLKIKFFDTDEIIEQREKEKITRIFQLKGEDYFREIESAVIREVSEEEGCVIATGGGAIIRKENYENLKKKGIIICLTAEPSTILLRTSPVTDRPLLLKSRDAITTIRHLMKIREPYYSNADYTIDTTELSPEETVEKILKILEIKDEKNQDKSR